MKKVRFIINPKSGTGKSKSVVSVIKKLIDTENHPFDICLTEAPGHASHLAREAVESKYKAVVAVGGDGSVNEVASVLTGTETALGIIPTGSGNGMARHLKIPVDILKSIHIVLTGKVEHIDTIRINDRFCIGTIGVGFDAHIAHLFAKAPKRGYSTYVKLVLTEFRHYREKRFSILVDGKSVIRNCFLLTFANSSQFGNNAIIAPFADVKDGLIDISLLRQFPLPAAPGLIYRLMFNSIQNSVYFKHMTAKEIIIKNSGELQGHIDGEPVIFNDEIKIKLHPLSIKVIVPQ